MDSHISNNFGSLENSVATPNPQKLAALRILALSPREYSEIQDGLRTGDLSSLRDSTLHSDPEVRAAGCSAIIKALSAGDLHHAQNLISTLNMGELVRNDQQFDQAKVEYLVKTLSSKDPNRDFRAHHFATSYQLPERVLADATLVTVVRQRITDSLTKEGGSSYLHELLPLSVILNDQDFKTELRNGAIHRLESRGWDGFNTLQRQFDPEGAWLRDPLVIATAREFIVASFGAGQFPRELRSIVEHLGAGWTSDAALGSAAREFLEAQLPVDPATWMVRELRELGLVKAEEFTLPSLRKATESGMLVALKRGDLPTLQELHVVIGSDPMVFDRPEFCRALREALGPKLAHFNGLGDPLREFHLLTPSLTWAHTPELQEQARIVADRMLSSNFGTSAVQFMERMGLSDDDLKRFPGTAGTIARGMEFQTVSELVSFLEKEREFFNDTRFFKDQTALELLTRSNYESGKALHLTTHETVFLLKKGVAIGAIQQEQDWQKLVASLKQQHPAWQDEIVSTGFDLAVGYLGSIEKVMSFINRPGLRRHDAFADIQAIVAMGEKSGLKPGAFYGQILAQVAKDNGLHGERHAHERLNHIARNFRYEATIDRCAEANDVPEVAALSTHFQGGPRSVFTSWAHLQQFQRLQELLDRRELLDGLRALPPTDRAILGPFIDEVAIRPGAKADLGQAVNFLIHPETFLDTPDPHTPQHIHNGKKPSNYTKIPHLDLTAKDLTIALAGGTYDLLQHLPALQIEYTLSSKSGGAVKLIATAHRKSDPRGYTVQNDTGSCDSFGAGKQIVSAFNPAISYFSIQLVRPDGTRRAIAQSMLTIDCDAGKPVPGIVAAMEKPGASLKEALSASVLHQGSRTLTCDNIEVARNYRDQGWGETIETIYQDFFYEYLQSHGQAAGLLTDKILIGENLTPVFTAAHKVPNTWVPVAPGSYSDNLGPSVLSVPVLPKVAESNRSFPGYNGPFIEAPPPTSNPHIQFLRPSDSLATSYLEEGAYSDNKELIVSLQNLESCLIASHINNRLKDRPDLSLKYVGDDDRVLGYLIAYEGRFTPDQELPLEPGERVVYVADLATHSEVRRQAGGQLAQALIDRWIGEYLPTGEIPPLVAELREHTSYRLVMSRLKHLSEHSALEFEVLHGEVQMRGEDRMFPTVIRAKIRSRTLSAESL
jgi:hypothetical protein